MVTKTDFEKIAALARLEFNDKELEGATGDLNNILNHIDQLREVDEPRAPALRLVRRQRAELVMRAHINSGRAALARIAKAKSKIA